MAYPLETLEPTFDDIKIKGILIFKKNLTVTKYEYKKISA